MLATRAPLVSRASRRARWAALLAAALFAFATPAASAKDCGERPRGKNPTDAELSQAMEELSLTFDVPTEIIKAVAYRESGVKQWRADGSLVINEKDCGLGMMQLTGATAERFDVPRLKSDWRYNLEAGATVLQSKWRRAVRTIWKKGKPLPAPNPKVLENWYYPLSLYQGRRTGEYPGKVFGHLKKRPGRLRRLLPASVEVSNPDDAIPGFAYGQRYTALPGDKIALEDGRTLRVKTTLGTMGDPKLLAQLDQVLARADRDRARGRLRRAIRYYRLVRDQRADAPQGKRAAKALAEIGAEAKGRFDEGTRLEAEGDYAGALLLYDEVEERYIGLPLAEAAGDRAEAIRQDPKLKARAEALEAERTGRLLLKKAARARKRGALLEAVRVLRLCANRYGDTAAASEAEDQLRRIEEDPTAGETLRALEAGRALRAALELGEGYLENGLFRKAVAAFEEAIRRAPAGSPEAARARRGLERAAEEEEGDD